MKKIILNKTNILLFLLIMTLVLLMVALLRVRVTSVKEGAPQQGNSVEKVTINKEDYRRNIQNALSEYEQLVADANIYGTSTRVDFGSDDPIFQRIDNLKNKIVDTKAPSMEYKDLHMNLVMSLLSIKDYLSEPANSKNIACVDLIKKVKKSQELLLD